jgi:hypothetical protein
VQQSQAVAAPAASPWLQPVRSATALGTPSPPGRSHLATWATVAKSGTPWLLSLAPVSYRVPPCLGADGQAEQEAVSAGRAGIMASPYHRTGEMPDPLRFTGPRVVVDRHVAGAARAAPPVCGFMSKLSACGIADRGPASTSCSNTSPPPAAWSKPELGRGQADADASRE